MTRASIKPKVFHLPKGGRDGIGLDDAAFARQPAVSSKNDELPPRCRATLRVIEIVDDEDDLGSIEMRRQLEAIFTTVSEVYAKKAQAAERGGPAGAALFRRAEAELAAVPLAG